MNTSLITITLRVSVKLRPRTFASSSAPCATKLGKSLDQQRATSQQHAAEKKTHNITADGNIVRQTHGSLMLSYIQPKSMQHKKHNVYYPLTLINLHGYLVYVVTTVGLKTAIANFIVDTDNAISIVEKLSTCARP
ncbi:hypothetical protein PsorP6_010469 [Peronosclerospora sorghi]|uniref:Uncharacterized protein n=1 Tax=Peronosclerospora sorghi TaxID=230839 RepID=A0ACC0VZ67_9STRA|nr:hypothetical protein PsorP6_010469 [Peronosclerospora sorghi]